MSSDVYVFNDPNATGSVTNLSSGTTEPEQSTEQTYDNVLSQYASYSCIITFALLSDQELNDPANTYRVNGPERIIARSGGSGTRQVLTAFEEDLGITAEYFIDDLEIQSVLTPTASARQTNSHVINFIIQEPYSMGTLLETLAVTTQDAYPELPSDDNVVLSYINVPYLLMIEFIGYDDDGNVIKIPNTTRYIPIGLNTLDFSVTPAGAQYNISATAWNEAALLDEVQRVKTDITIEGSTVAEFLQLTGSEDRASLSSTINEIEQSEKQSDSKPQPDQYVIAFPTDSAALSRKINQAQESNQGATTEQNQTAPTRVTSDGGITIDRIKRIVEDESEINEIGKAKLSKSAFDGTKKMGLPEDQEQETDGGARLFKRGNLVIEEDFNSISITRGMRIQDIIEEIILMSEYGEQLVTEPPDSKGMIKYFRIETDVYTVGNEENYIKRQNSAKIYVFKVLVYKINQFLIQHVTKSPVGIEELRRNIPKKYDYLYTGKNDDIINFDLQFNTAFYQGIGYDLGNTNQDIVLNRIDENTVLKINEGTGNTNEATGQIISLGTTNTGNRGLAGDITQTNKTQIARYFNDAILNSPADLITVELEIWGDPYYFSDSGIGNYSADPDNEQPQTTANKSIDYQQQSPFLLLNFRTPLDYNQTNDSDRYGEMEFSTKSKAVSQFSGIYMINAFTNTISQNKFTQLLSLVRIRNQEGTGEAQSLVENGNTDNLSLFAENALFGFQASSNAGQGE